MFSLIRSVTGLEKVLPERQLALKAAIFEINPSLCHSMFDQEDPCLFRKRREV